MGHFADPDLFANFAEVMRNANCDDNSLEP